MTATITTNSVTFGDSKIQTSASYKTFRNLIDNGDFRVDNKYDGTALAVSQGTGSNVLQIQDRWIAGGNNASTTPGITTQRTNYNPGDPGYATSNSGLRIVCSTYSGAGNITFGQRIEGVDCARFAGKTMTLSMRMTALPSAVVTWSAYTPTTKDTWGIASSFNSNKTLIAGATGTFSVIPGSALFTSSFNMPAIADAMKGIELQFSWSTPSVNQYLDVTNVQLESGAIRTPFEIKPLDWELKRCARFAPSYWGYYYNTDGTATATTGLPMLGVGVGTTTAAAQYLIPLKVPTRVPTTSIESPNGFLLTANTPSGGGGLLALASTSLASSTEKDIIFNQTAYPAIPGGSHAAGDLLRLHLQNTLGVRIWFTGAEL